MFLLVPLAAGAQDDTDAQFWIDYDPHWYIKPNWEFYADAGLRFLDTGDWKQIYARPSMRYYSPGKWEGHFGIGGFFTYEDNFENLFELRPWQGFKIRWPRFERFSISHYFRAEERFLFETDNWTSEATLRLRYQIGTRVPLNRKSGKEDWFIPLSVEFFANAENLNERFANRMRLGMGLGHIFGREWVGEMHLIVQSSNTGNFEFKTTDYIFRVQIKRLLTTRDYADDSE